VNRDGRYKWQVFCRTKIDKIERVWKKPLEQDEEVVEQALEDTLSQEETIERMF
jgi:predicted component of type VI protein secretion system